MADRKERIIPIRLEYSNDDQDVAMPVASDNTPNQPEEQQQVESPRKPCLASPRTYAGVLNSKVEVPANEIRPNDQQPLNENPLSAGEPINEVPTSDNEPIIENSPSDNEPESEEPSNDTALVNEYQLSEKESVSEHQLNNEAPTDTDQLIDKESPKPAIKIVIKPEEPEVVDKELWNNYNSDWETQLGLQYPPINVKEHILLVIDRAQDEDYTPFRAGDDKFSPLEMLKRATITFLRHKRTIDKKHEYALAVLNTNSVSIVHGFTNDIDKLERLIHKIDECVIEDVFNMNLLFEEVLKVAPLSPPGDKVPKFLTRTLLFYSRSYTVPKFVLNDDMKTLLDNPFFIVDIVMTHEPVSAANNCDKIFEALQLMDRKGRSYFLPVSRDFGRLMCSVGRALGHPLQRPFQASYGEHNGNERLLENSD